MAFRDSYAVLFHGPRRGGKTLSMVFQAILDLLRGTVVYSNFPIIFNFGGRQYQSLELDYMAFLNEDPCFEGSSICWDETAFFAFNRQSLSLFNKFISMALILIGKEEINFYMASQFASMLDKNVRLQTDALILCTDLSFEYPHLERGAVIGHFMQDISGRFTGRTFEMTGRYYQRTLHGKPFWFCYNTKHLFDYASASKKITREDISGAKQYENHHSAELAQAFAIGSNVMNELVTQGQTEVRRSLFQDMMRNAGSLVTSEYIIEHRLLPHLGIKKIGGIYQLPSLVAKKENTLFETPQSVGVMP